MYTNLRISKNEEGRWTRTGIYNWNVLAPGWVEIDIWKKSVEIWPIKDNKADRPGSIGTLSIGDGRIVIIQLYFCWLHRRCSFVVRLWNVFDGVHCSETNERWLGYDLMWWRKKYMVLRKQRPIFGFNIFRVSVGTGCQAGLAQLAVHEDREPGSIPYLGTRLGRGQMHPIKCTAVSCTCVQS